MTTLTQSDLDDIRRAQLLRKEHAKQSSMDYAEGVQCLIDCDMLLSHIAELAAENARRKTKKRQFPSLCSPEQNAESLLQYYAKQGVGDMALLQALEGLLIEFVSNEARITELEAERDQLRKQVEGLRWEPISTAPETGEDLELLLQDGEISEARWNNERYCMLGSRAGSFPPGWSPTRSSGVDLNLPMTFDGNEPTHWRLAAASALEQKEQG